jgi:hypothetical protein
MTKSDITRFTSLRCQPQEVNGVIPDQYLKGMYVPSLTTTQINTLVDSDGDHTALIAYDKPLNVYKGLINGVINTFNTSPATATGVGLTSGSPSILPSGTAVAVEVVANEVNGFMYYNTTATNIRAFVNDAWVTVTTA